MIELIERVERSIAVRHLVRSREKLVVAVSGGLDSVVLLNLLHRLSSKYSWRLLVAHFNHRLRGRSSDADEKFVRNLAGHLRLPIVTDFADVRAVANDEKISIEMAARRLRHAFLARTASQRRAGSVALAHHADDQVELFFLRLIRGAGGEGLAGMRWLGPSPVDSKVRLIRPLLDISRRELERFAREEKIGFRKDATNDQLNFERNRVRHELLPVLRGSFSGKVDQTILRAMEILGAEADFAGESARIWLAKKESDEFDRLHPAVQRRVLQEQLFALRAVPDFDSIERLRITGNKRVASAGGRTFWRDQHGIIHEESGTDAKDFNPRALSFPLRGKSGEVSFGGWNISWRRRRRSERGARWLPRLPACEYFDAKQVGSVVHVRHWRPGDRFQPIGMSEPVKLQDWFVNQKVPRSIRPDLLLAASERGEIFWIEGSRIGECCKITATTTELLEWRLSTVDSKTRNQSRKAQRTPGPDDSNDKSAGGACR